MRGRDIFTYIGAAALIALTMLAVPGSAAAAPAGDQGDPAPDLPVEFRSAVLMNVDTGRVLWDANPQEAAPMASLTKTMTAYVTLQHAEPEEIITVPLEAREVEGTRAYLRPGEHFTVRSLLDALMINSGNDAGTALAWGVAGDEETFVEWMNDAAAKLGLEDTTFRNPHGLDEPGHLSTAADLARLARHVLRDPLLARIVAQEQVTLTNAHGEVLRTVYNHNDLVRQHDDVTGVKTGYTRRARFCTILSAEREGVTLVAVVLGAPTEERRDDYALDLLEWGFAGFVPTSVTDPEQMFEHPTAAADGAPITAVPEYPVTAMLPAEAPDDIELEPEWTTLSVDAEELAAGTPVGTLTISVAGQEVAPVPLVTADRVVLVREGTGGRGWFRWVYGAAVLLLLLAGLSFLRWRRRRRARRRMRLRRRRYGG